MPEAALGGRSVVIMFFSYLDLPLIRDKSSLLGYGIWFLGFGFWGFGVSGLGYGVSDLGYGVSCLVLK